MANYQELLVCYCEHSYLHGLKQDIEFLRSSREGPFPKRILIDFVAGRKLGNCKIYWHVKPYFFKDYWKKTEGIVKILSAIWDEASAKKPNFQDLLVKVAREISVKKIPYISTVTIYDLTYRMSVLLDVPLNSLFVKAGSDKGLKILAEELNYKFEVANVKEGKLNLNKIENFPKELMTLFINKFGENGHAHIENYLCALAERK